MMIFNWVNRKLHQKDHHPQSGGIDGSFKGKREYDRNYKNLLYDITEWSADDILAIGTLGFVDLGFGDSVSLKKEDVKEACLINNGDDDDDIDSNINEVEDVHELSVLDSQIKATMKKKKKKEDRTSLADLFSAEYSNDKVTIIAKPPEYNREIQVTATAYGDDRDNKWDQTKAKNLVPLPVKKFHKAMKRMLNRKIHPELVVKLNGIQDDLERKSFQQYV